MRSTILKPSWANFSTSLIALSLCLGNLTSASAFTPSQQPPESTAVPGNVLLALSVEFPTGLQVSYTAGFSVLTKYDGYFDNRKCYTYSSSDEAFQPVSALNTNGTCPVASQWSGNLLNWLTMTNVDQFRYVMTGGTRDSFSSMAGTYPGDINARTVLIRSFSDRNSYNPNKTVTGLAGMPLSGTKIVRSAGFGSKFIVSGSNNFVDLSSANRLATCAATPLPSTGACYNIRVRVCETVPPGQAVPTVGLESNCKSNYSYVSGGTTIIYPKPEGLIQEYANALRFGAFGYLNETGNNRSGGVLRSAMKSVGATAATATGVTENTANEWDATTGIMINNPDPADATASSVSNSGLMNYFNKFGYAAGYKGNDPVGEMYYAAQLYMRGKTPPTSYSDNLTAALKDDFPVITGSNLRAGQTRDPIINTCQKNFILGIGDIYTHCDGNLPGSTSAACTGGTPSDPDNLNVQTLWHTTAGLEGIADNGWYDSGNGRNGTPYMAGLAHWANTNDIRTDLSGKQTISTYWVDVLENNANNVAAASLWKSQFWLTAKYGGFDTSLVTGNNPNTVPASWDANSDGIPDTWFAGSNPTSMKAGLTAAFADIAIRSGVNSASSAAVTSNRQTSNSQVLYAGYNPKGWMGNVRACSPTQTAAQCDATPTWESSQWFKTLTSTYTTPPSYVTTPLTPTTRKIFTSSLSGASLTSMPFLYNSLNTTQKAILDATDSQGPARVDFLRGNRSNENVIFRKREDTLLGDIVNSGVTYLSGAGPAYAGNVQTAYLAFRTANKVRRPVVYVGANDGMLHAFSGVNGKELFAYIPASVFNNLPSLTALGFQHKFFVDGTPMVGDIQQNPSTWKTVLVGGLGAGGKGYYALNITDQNAFSTSWSDTTLTALPSIETGAEATAKEATLSTLPMWEYTSNQDADMGYTFNEPALDPFNGAYRQIAKVADNATNEGVWRVIVGNGYGSTAGKAALFMLDANTGADTGTGLAPTKLIADSGPNNGLSAPTPVDTDKDGLIDTVYAGDALGNMHKFQFSKQNTAGTDYVLAPAGTAGGGAWRHIGILFATGQPISTAPSVSPSCEGIGWNVSFGTGKLNESGDYADTSARGFYAVDDKNPSSALTVAGTHLLNIPYTTSVVSTSSVRTWTAPTQVGTRGWKMAFTGGERVLSNSTLPPDTGVVLFATTKPTGDVCAPGNAGFIMAVNLCSGKIGDLSVAGTLVGGLGVDSTGVVKVSNTFTNTDNKQQIVCNQDACKGPGPTLSPVIAPKGRYSWREIFTK